MCDRMQLARYYSKFRSDGLDERSKKTYETFENARESLKESGDDMAVKMLDDIYRTSDRYLTTITKYDPAKLSMMSPGERDLQLKNWSETRRATHNSLISKINMSTRYFFKNDIGNIADLPNTTQENREPAGDFANQLILGDYLTKR